MIDCNSYASCCAQDLHTSVVLDGVAFGQQGSWSLNMWFKAGNLSGDGFEYIYSQGSSVGSLDADYWGANQVRLYIPEAMSEKFGRNGIIRAMIKDNDDNTDPMYIDSDGQVAGTPSTAGATDLVVQDGAWHMLTLTTLTPLQPGFQLFVDGALATYIDSQSIYINGSGAPVVVSGGGPMRLEGPISLCARAAIDPTRHFDGQLAQLSIWNKGLSMSQIARLYTLGWQSSPLGVGDATVTALAASGPSVTGLPNATPSSLASLVHSANLPRPLAYFPLTDGSFSSKPLGTQDMQYAGFGESISFGPDLQTGTSVMQCSKAQDSYAVLDTVPYGRQGPFAINLWFKVDDIFGDSYAYLYSHESSSPSDFGPNQVKLYFPEAGYPGFGLIRAMVKDSTDAYQEGASRVWLDSDGLVGVSADERNEQSKQLAAGQELLTDAQWHMATLTTLPNGTRGFQMYLDGQLAAEMVGSHNYFHDSVQLQVDGGNPLAIDGYIYLCSVNASDGRRAFTGGITQLTIWDNALTDSQMATLSDLGASGTGSAPTPAPSIDQELAQLEALLRQLAPGRAERPTYITAQPLVPAPSATITYSLPPFPGAVLQAAPPPQAAVTPAPQCTSPLYYDGLTLTGCVTLSGGPDVPVCWSTDEGWLECPASNISQAIIQSDPRTTVDGQSCLLPYVVRGRVVPDCILLFGVLPFCATDTGGGICAPPAAPTPQPSFITTAVTSPVTSAIRKTVDGDNCRLPLVFNGSFVQDCFGVGPDLVEQCSSAATRQWTPCVPAATPVRLPVMALLGNGAAADGLQGSLCTLAGAAFQQGCTRPFACVPIPALYLGPNILQGPNVTNTTIGYCAGLPEGTGTPALARAYGPVTAAVLPAPMAFFSLAPRQLPSTSLPTFDDHVSNQLGVQPDLYFDDVISCSAADQSVLKLEGVPYGTRGPWAINLWFRANTSARPVGKGLQYMFSHVSTAASPADGLAANQIQVYITEPNNSAAGIVRTIVRDSSNGPINANFSFVYLDSNGAVNQNYSRPAQGQGMNDQQWHMLTLSTHSDGTPGYSLFLDGQAAGDLSQDSRDPNGDAVQVGGGQPMDLDSDMVLCARYDLEPQRYFSGSLAHLGLFDSALSSLQVQRLYESYIAPGTAAGAPVQTQGYAVQPSIAEAPTSLAGLLPAGAGAPMVRQPNQLQALLQAPPPSTEPEILHFDDPSSFLGL